MKDFILNRLIILLIICCLFFSGCAVLKRNSWEITYLNKYGFSFETPKPPRHFTMKTQGLRGEQSYHEWILNDAKSGNQFIVVVKETNKPDWQFKPDSWVLDNIESPRIGFLEDSRELSKARKYNGMKPYDEKEMILSSQKRAISRSMIINHNLVMLIFTYYDESSLETAGNRFLQSIKDK